MSTRRWVAMMGTAFCMMSPVGRADEPIPVAWTQDLVLWREANLDPGRREAILYEVLGKVLRGEQPTERPPGYPSPEEVLLYVVRAIDDEATTRRVLERLAGADTVRAWRVATEIAWQRRCLDEYIALMRHGSARGYPIRLLQQWNAGLGEVPEAFVERGSTLHIRLSTLRASIRERQDREPESDLWAEWIAGLLEVKRVRDMRRK